MSATPAERGAVDDGARHRAGIAELEAFVSEHGHARAPATYRTSTGFRLGLWVRNRRRDYLAGRLPAATVAQLEAFPEWAWQPAADARMLALREFREYREKHGTRPIPRSFVCANGFRLGAWAAGRRAAYRRGELSGDAIREIEALPGWSWGGPPPPTPQDKRDASDREQIQLRTGARVHVEPRVLWETGLRHLDRFVLERRHGAVPREYVCDDRFPLGAWIATNRTAFHRGELTRDQIAQLESRPNWRWGSAS